MNALLFNRKGSYRKMLMSHSEQKQNQKQYIDIRLARAHTNIHSMKRVMPQQHPPWPFVQTAGTSQRSRLLMTAFNTATRYAAAQTALNAGIFVSRRCRSYLLDEDLIIDIYDIALNLVFAIWRLLSHHWLDSATKVDAALLVPVPIPNSAVKLRVLTWS